MPVVPTPPDAPITASAFGATKRGEAVERYLLRGAGGMEMSVLTYGARIQALRAPDRKGDLADVVLGYDDLAGYEDDEPYHGAVVGRVANRIGGAAFTLDGVTYRLAANQGKNHLHGGPRGFSRVVWEAEAEDAGDDVAIVFRYLSPDGEEGYPGTLRVQVRYALTAASELTIDYHATTDRPTPVNLLQHVYLNLAGEGSGLVLDHVLQVDADHYTALDEESIPTGAIEPVEGTPFDFREPRRIGERIEDDHEQIRIAGGYDQNFVLRHDGSSAGWAARLSEPSSGRAVDVFTTEPGLQLYTGNLLGGHVGKQGHRYPARSGVCLETQHFADSPNQPSFPSVILRPGSELVSRTVYAFSVVPEGEKG
ncbi:MAG: galactose mutarotase [Gemmatimonadetes bacterium]|nr:galactose mutarotase [Gemmatimonadota bacterium]